MEPRKRPSAAILACAFVLAVWVAIAFVIFSPTADCNDCNVKYVQAQSLIRSGFRSMTLAYPGAMFDSQWRFLPLKPPFTLDTPGGPNGVQGIWSPSVILVQTPLIMAGGLDGVVVFSLLSGVIILWSAVRLGGRPNDWALPIIVAFGTCLWYYAVQPWEHVPAVAALMAGLALATTTRRHAPLLGGLLVGAGVILRDETLLLVPILLLLIWHTHRRVRPLVVACAGVGGVLVAAAVLDFFGYGRPPAAHMMHAVSALRSLFHPSFPSRQANAVAVLSLAERYDVVVHYWLTSSLSRLVVLAFVAAAIAAASVNRWARSSIGVLVLAVVMLAWSGRELWMRVPAPRSIPSLFPLSPFIVFAIFPAPNLSPETRRMRWLLLAGSLVCLVVAILMTDTAGGKSMGPRLLLGLMPLLSVTAWAAIRGYLRSDPANRMHHVIGWVGVALVLISIGMNICGLRAWAGRVTDDSRAQQAVERSPVRIVVVDDAYTAQMFMPLYFRKVLMMAEYPLIARDLSGALARAGVRVVLLVSRNDTPKISLEPYRLVSSEAVGRLTVQHWVQ